MVSILVSPMRQCSQRFLVIVFPVLAALFVLLAQYGANLHALSHATQEIMAGSPPVQDQQSPNGHEHCEQYLAFAAAGAALASPPSLALHDFAHAAPTALAVAQIAARTTNAYRSRAPPLILV